jgi:hypothetical protein
MSNLERFGKLARRAYYQAIDGWAHDREWETLSESERRAWESVGCVIRTAPAADASLDERLLGAFRENTWPKTDRGTPALEHGSLCGCGQCTGYDLPPCARCGSADHGLPSCTNPRR